MDCGNRAGAIVQRRNIGNSLLGGTVAAIYPIHIYLQSKLDLLRSMRPLGQLQCGTDCGNRAGSLIASVFLWFVLGFASGTVADIHSFRVCLNTCVKLA